MKKIIDYASGIMILVYISVIFGGEDSKGILFNQDISIIICVLFGLFLSILRIIDMIEKRK